MKSVSLIGIPLLMALVVTPAAFGGHFPEPVLSPVQMHIAGSLTFNGQSASVGDEVAVFGKTGMLVGSFALVNDGLYGSMVIMGDHPATGDSEGAEEREELKIKVWRYSQQREYEDESIRVVLPPEGIGIYQKYADPSLLYHGGRFFLLHIEVKEE